MHKAVRNVANVAIVPAVGEPREASPVDPAAERREGCHERVETEVELLAAHEVGVVDVPLHAHV